jgi:hypothetical protein
MVAGIKIAILKIDYIARNNTSIWNKQRAPNLLKKKIKFYGYSKK